MELSLDDIGVGLRVLPQERQALLFEHASQIRDYVVGHIGDSRYDVGGAGTVVEGAEHDMVHIGHRHCAEAHRAGLDRAVEDALVVVILQIVGATEERVQFGMGEVTPARSPGVRTTADDATVMHDHRADGNVSPVQGSARLDQRFLQEGFVFESRDVEHAILPERICERSPGDSTSGGGATFPTARPAMGSLWPRQRDGRCASDVLVRGEG